MRRSRSIRSLRLTERDIEIINHVFRHRFLRSTQICRLIDGSQQGILRRLQALFHHGYLERPPLQIQYYRKAHNSPFVYGIARKGAEALEVHRQIPQKNFDWMLGKRTKAQFMEHTLAVADFMVDLETKWIQELGAELIRKEKLESRSNSPSKWKVHLHRQTEHVTHYIEPDAFFALKFKENPDEEIGFILELDRGTMPVRRKSLKHSSIYRKILSYQSLWKNGFFKRKHHWKRVRVIFAITSPNALKRTDSIQLHIPISTGLFQITQLDKVTPDLFHEDS